MTRDRLVTAARNTGHVAWWIFVVATLFAGGVTWLGLQDDEWFSARSSGWMAYTPLTDPPVAIANFTGPQPYEWWTEPEVFAAIAFAVVVIAAVVEAVTIRRIGTGLMTIAAPLVALGILIVVTPRVFTSFELATVPTMCVVLLAVAVREVWARRGSRERDTHADQATVGPGGE